MLKHAVFLTILLGAFWFLARGRAQYGPFGYDEADYMFAVSRGVAANAFDTPSLTMPQFLRIGLGRGRDASRGSELSELIRNSGDVVFYRHWHGPLYIYALILSRQFLTGEETMRVWNTVIPMETALLIYLGSLWILPGAAGRIAAILGAALWLWSYPVVNTTELGPHGLFAIWVVCSLFFLARAAEGRRYWYLSVASAALAFCTLEVALALMATLFVYAWLMRERLKPDVAFAAKSIGVFVGVVLVVWPAAIFKLSFLKAYLFMAYLAVFRKGAWGSNIGIAGTWWLRFATTPVPWILLAAAVVILAVRGRKIGSAGATRSRGVLGFDVPGHLKGQHRSAALRSAAIPRHRAAGRAHPRALARPLQRRIANRGSGADLGRDVRDVVPSTPARTAASRPVPLRSR